MSFALATRPRRAAFLLAFGAAAVGGCAPVRVRATPEPGAPRLAAVPADSVRVFADTADLPKPYRVVARLRAEAGPVLSSRAVTARLRERAGAMGANGIVVRGGVEFGLGISTRDSVLAVRVGGAPQ